MPPITSTKGTRSDSADEELGDVLRALLARRDLRLDQRMDEDIGHEQAVSSRPGTMPAMNSFDTEVSVKVP